jgi:hypothetical protein
MHAPSSSTATGASSRAGLGNFWATPAAKGLFLALLCAACWVTGGAGATGTNSNAMTLTIDASDPGPAVASNFIGIAVSSWSIDDDNGYTKCFTTANSEMVNLFRQIGIKHLRTIMGPAVSSEPDPSNSEIDAFFDFAAASGVNKIIWSLHLYNAEVTTNWSNNKAIATHIWTTITTNGTVESNLLDSFAFDNEPDWLKVICCTDPNITGYYTPASTGGYNGEWNSWRQTIVALTPGAKFSGPDTGSKWPCPGEINTSIDSVPFTLRFATDESSNISTATQHFYGQTGISNFTVTELAEACLSSNWLTTNYTTVNNDIVGSLAMPYRFTECSAFDNETNAGNQCFATGLWALDFYHWWARHGCAGVDPFTRTAQYDSPIYFDGTNYLPEPYAYAMKAFNLGSGGNVIYTSKFLIDNPGNLNVTAYGVVNATDLYVTVINKTFDSVTSYVANVTIPAPTGFAMQFARYMVLSGGPTPGSSGNATIDGACLGGAEIPNDGSSWAGTWTPLAVTAGGVSLAVQPTTAVIIDLQNIQVTLQSPQMSSGGVFSFVVNGPAGYNYTIQTSTDMVHWTTVETVPNQTGSIDVILSNGGPSTVAYFYRAALVP